MRKQHKRMYTHSSGLVFLMRMSWCERFQMARDLALQFENDAAMSLSGGRETEYRLQFPSLTNIR